MCNSILSLNYDMMKAAILRAYELVPEACRQRFRGHKKNPSQSFIEFASEKGILFDKWYVSSKVTDFKTLQELTLLQKNLRTVFPNVSLFI